MAAPAENSCPTELKCFYLLTKRVELFPPGLEPRTSRVLGERDNHYTTGTGCWRARAVGLTATADTADRPS